MDGSLAVTVRTKLVRRAGGLCQSRGAGIVGHHGLVANFPEGTILAHAGKIRHGSDGLRATRLVCGRVRWRTAFRLVGAPPCARTALRRDHRDLHRWTESLPDGEHGAIR